MNYKKGDYAIVTTCPLPYTKYSHSTVCVVAVLSDQHLLAVQANDNTIFNVREYHLVPIKDYYSTRTNSLRCECGAVSAIHPKDLSYESHAIWCPVRRTV